MRSAPILYAISAGPGDPDLITVAGLKALRECDVLFAPRASSSSISISRRIIEHHGIAPERFRETEFDMSRDRGELETRYDRLAAEICDAVAEGHQVGYITLGDSLVYSTCIYALDAVRRRRPDVKIVIVPGVTSGSAVAAANQWPLGERKERVLMLPCPDDMESLRRDILDHDVVILMKIGERFPGVIDLLDRMGLLDLCALGHRVGMPEEVSRSHLREALTIAESAGYLSTILIRKTPREGR